MPYLFAQSDIYNLYSLKSVWDAVTTNDIAVVVLPRSVNYCIYKWIKGDYLKRFI